MASASKDQLQYGGPAATRKAAPAGSDGSKALPADHLLIARPHLQLRGNTLDSLGVPDRSRQLSSSEVYLWKLLQRSMRVREVQQHFGCGADLLIRSFLRDGLCELFEYDFSVNRRRVLVVEPHADDAVLSIGGTMWLRRHDCAFVIATMASRSNHTRYRDLGVNHDINTVTEIRRREAELAAQMVGGQHVSVGMTDAPLRYHDAEWTEEFYRRHQLSIDASISRVAGEPELRRWRDALLLLISEQRPAEVWFPLGGPHADHMLTADACLATFVAHPSLVQDCTLRIYQDVPYAVRYPHHMTMVLAAMRQAGMVLEHEVTSIAPVLAEKRRLASLYDSQEMEELFTAGGDLPESLWRVQALPRQLPAGGIASQVIAAQEPGASAVAAWVARHRDASYLRVLLMTATGRWQSDLNMLSATFPRARFEVCIATTAEAELAQVSSDLVDTRIVAGGTWAWLLESLRLCLSQPAPTLLQAAATRVRPARLLSRLWLGSDALVISSMDQLANAPRIARGD